MLCSHAITQRCRTRLDPFFLRDKPFKSDFLSVRLHKFRAGLVRNDTNLTPPDDNG